MNLTLIIGISVLAVISVLWALWSLYQMQKSEKVSEDVKKELENSRVIFHSSSSSEGV